MFAFWGSNVYVCLLLSVQLAAMNKLITLNVSSMLHYTPLHSNDYKQILAKLNGQG